jgi:predicted HTH domain antitoxin
LYVGIVIEFFSKKIVLEKKLMRTIQINIPDSVDMQDYDFLMTLAAKLYEEEKLSVGQAAEMAGLSKRAFIEMLGKYNVSIFSKSVSDLKSDILYA